MTNRDQTLADRAEQRAIARHLGATMPDGFIDRDVAVRLIRDALRRRSGRPWSVTAGRGTVSGWLTIMSRPADRVCVHHVDGEECPTPEHCQQHRYYLSEADCVELGRLLGLDVHHQGVSISDRQDDRRAHIARAQTGGPCGYRENV